MRESIHQRESDFHDGWAASASLKEIAVGPAFESPTAMENRFILRQMGDLRGRRVLDLGCGLGESSVYFALQGAIVTAVDISPGMIATACELARYHGVAIEGLVAAGEEFGVSAGQYDFAYAANTLHHVVNKEKFIRLIHEALKPGGRVFFWDPLAYNPVINVYRRMATQVRTPDEAPLSFRVLGQIRKFFVGVRHREFWLLSLALFLKYYVIDRVHPNEQRYWKRIYRESPGGLWWWRPLTAIDTVLTRIPLLRRLAWNIVIWGTKEDGNGRGARHRLSPVMSPPSRGSSAPN
jgi:SAM-dependent methyltransferase